MSMYKEIMQNWPFTLSEEEYKKTIEYYRDKKDTFTIPSGAVVYYTGEYTTISTSPGKVIASYIPNTITTKNQPEENDEYV